MKLPVPLQQRIESELAQSIRSINGVSGGCISSTARVALQDGSCVFLKWASRREHISGMFREESRSLTALAAGQEVRVPQLIHVRDEEREDFAYLLLEWLEPGSAREHSWRLLGSALARLHRRTAESYGWDSDNFIGSLPQSNERHSDWPTFWRDCRLLPQLERAKHHFAAGELRRLHALLEGLADLLADAAADGPSMLHGDLWNGNVHMLADGTPALIDPSTYYGHREVDLAMSKLFGGFGADFYDAYEIEWPLCPGSAQRVLVYQLYYLLVHVNLFGGSYVNSTQSTVAQLGF